MAETNVEHEFKFDVDADFDPPDLRRIVGRTERLPTQQLTTTYLDTPDGRLWARGITLRHRAETESGTGASGPGKWTLKLPLADEPADDPGTSRSELSWKGPPGDVPAPATSILAGVVRRGRLQPTVSLSTERRRLLLHDDQAAWAEIDDDLATVTSGPRQGLRFRQIELELTGGDGVDRTSHLVKALAELRRAGAIPGGSAKYALAAGLAAPAPARRATDVRSMAADVIGTGLAAVLDLDVRLRATEDAGADPERALTEAALEAVARLRVDLRILGAVLDPVWASHARRDLAEVAEALVRIADVDGVVDRVRGGPVSGADGDARHHLVALASSERHQSVTDLSTALRSQRYLDGLERLQAGADRPPLAATAGGHGAGTPLRRVMGAAVTTARRVLLAELDQVGPPHEPDYPQHLHLLAARLRRATELAEPHVPGVDPAAVERAQRIERALRPLVAEQRAARLLSELATHPAATPTLAFSAGRLAGWSECRAAHLDRAWRRKARRLLVAGGDAAPS